MTPNCPVCDQPPKFVIGVQGVCGNMECNIIFWRIDKTLDENLTSVGTVNLHYRL